MPQLTPEQAKKLEEKFAASAATPKSAKPSRPSRIASLGRGVARGLGDAIDPAAQFIVDRLAFTPNGPMDTKLGTNVESETGVPPATDKIGRDIEYFGQGVGSALPFAPVAAMGAPALGISGGAAVAGELGLGGFAGLFQGSVGEENPTIRNEGQQEEFRSDKGCAPRTGQHVPIPPKGGCCEECAKRQPLQRFGNRPPRTCKGRVAA